MRAILIQLPDDHDTLLELIETIELRLDRDEWRAEGRSDLGSIYILDAAEVEVSAGLRAIVDGDQTTTIRRAEQ